jgi:hypothetical protein
MIGVFTEEGNAMQIADIISQHFWFQVSAQFPVNPKPQNPNFKFSLTVPPGRQSIEKHMP